MTFDVSNNANGPIGKWHPLFIASSICSRKAAPDSSNTGRAIWHLQSVRKISILPQRCTSCLVNDPIPTSTSCRVITLPALRTAGMISSTVKVDELLAKTAVGLHMESNSKNNPAFYSITKSQCARIVFVTPSPIFPLVSSAANVRHTFSSLSLQGIKCYYAVFLQRAELCNPGKTMPTCSTVFARTSGRSISDVLFKPRLDSTFSLPVSHFHWCNGRAGMLLAHTYRGQEVAEQ